MESGIDASRRGPMPARTFKLTPSWRARCPGACVRATLCATFRFHRTALTCTTSNTLCFRPCRVCLVDVRRTRGMFIAPTDPRCGEFARRDGLFASSGIVDERRRCERLDNNFSHNSYGILQFLFPTFKIETL